MSKEDPIRRNRADREIDNPARRQFCKTAHFCAPVSIGRFQCRADRPQSFYGRAARAERAVSSLEESGMGRLKTEGASGEEAEEAYLEVGMGRLKMKGASGASP